ncbi:glycoside hydrolase family 16 protein [uncultured Sphingorhabdus sp.]|uniref:glycoside hydrolase family 16 protein n=1 Tax=uncultured Sphingorhabdus sp. TaxID=1686106 RepID=UPI002630A7D3|nr:glycoside hydrolase family 16 protein [uncultured Sphingorhabdus sp.]HMS20954.1 glycoside hydrolase family 16 protein [Sphingorhabdus sp.]
MRMKPVFLAFLAVVTVSGRPALAAEQPAEWSLVWSDEFDGNQLDRSKWKPEMSCWGGGNNERQCYTDRSKNIRVANGKLLLVAHKEKFRGPDRPPEIASNPNPKKTQSYTSGKIRTLGISSWKYGKIEFRAKPPRGQGTWPAVWMMPSENFYGRWPLSGEIDILEGVNLGATCPQCEGNVGENRMISALHFGDYAPKNKVRDTRVALPSLALPSDEFHVWTLEWGEGLMRFYLDGRQYWELTEEDWNSASPKAKGNPVAPFDQPFYIMANLAIGGKLSEDNNDKGVADNVTPAVFAIDWIRIYQCSTDRETGLACMNGGEREE